MSKTLTQESSNSNPRPGLAEYVRISLALGVFCGFIGWIADAAVPEPEPEKLLSPIFALVALTALVWLSMVLMRNVAILRGIASVAYFVDYKSEVPSEWIERPARTFNNLMQVPTLFYLVCVLMIATKRVDHAQLMLAWTFVATRTVHAAVYIGWNKVPYRFACWIAGCITLGLLWTRFALQG